MAGVAYIVGEFDKPVEQSPVVFFAAEFLGYANKFTGGFWTVDWNGAGCAMARKFYHENACRGDCLKGVKVTYDGSVIWLLTGEFDFEKNMYEGKWPD